MKDPERIACLMPTYNRNGSGLGHLLAEAVESFLRQTYPNKELIILNDTPGEVLIFQHPDVKVINTQQRAPTLSHKLQFLIDSTTAPLLCRWDDDDISLPHRLAFSRERLGEKLEWRASNYWYDSGTLREVDMPGNTHVMSLWRREVLAKIGGYPAGLCTGEDQRFNELLHKVGISPWAGERLDPPDIFYIYRWATGSRHLSGNKDGPAQWANIGQQPLKAGHYMVQPRWLRDYAYLANEAAYHYQGAAADTLPDSSHAALCDLLVAKLPRGGRIALVGDPDGGAGDLLRVGHLARASGRRLSVVYVGCRKLVGPRPPYVDFSTLMSELQQHGLADVVTPMFEEPTKAAGLFANGSFDAVVLADDQGDLRAKVQAWLPKVTRGGWLAGASYGVPSADTALAVGNFFNCHPVAKFWDDDGRVWLHQTV